MRAPATALPIEMELNGIVTRAIEWGPHLYRTISLPAGVDFTPLFVGLPGDLCQSPHWGYILSGSINIRYADGTQETCYAGDVYYWPEGHTGWTEDGVSFVEVSPTELIRPVLEHLAAQLAPVP